jgi:hypothetical protein
MPPPKLTKVQPVLRATLGPRRRRPGVVTCVCLTDRLAGSSELFVQAEPRLTLQHDLCRTCWRTPAQQVAAAAVQWVMPSAARRARIAACRRSHRARRSSCRPASWLPTCSLLTHGL